MRVAMAVVVGAACALTSGGRELPTAPPPRAKPTDADWLPKPSDLRVVDSRLEGLSSDPPTAFPDIAISVISLRTREDVEKHWANFEKRCPQLSGTVTLKIEATDDAFQKLLKARLHQGTLEFQQYRQTHFGPIVGAGPSANRFRECLLDMASVVNELWARRPQERVSWLEELLIASKEFERYARVRASVGTVPPSDLHAASRFRLKMEAELWKAKNAK